MSSLLGGGGGASAPKQPPFHPMDISNIANSALNKDISFYQSQQFPVFPGLADARNAEIQDAYKQLTSPLAPEFQSEFMKNATLTARGTVGGGDAFSAMGMQKGSMAAGSQTASFTKQALAKQDYDRARMESLIQQNPLPGLGLSQGDLLSMTLYNTGAQNQWSMSNYANQIAGANAAYQNQVSTWNSIGNTISGLGGIYGQMGGFGGGYSGPVTGPLDMSGGF